MGVYGKRTLLVVDQQNDAVWKSVRNIDRLNTTLAHQLNAYDLVNADAVVLTQDGLARVKEVFST
jgi:large subunit ribosomal protein L4